MLAITHASGTPYAVGYVEAQSSLRKLYSLSRSKHSPLWEAL